jgi:CheY-like chemotaxis protein
MKSKTAKRPIEILIVDDNPGDVRLTLEALKDGKVQNRLHTAHDGVEAIAFLRRKGEYADVPLPDLILLDLNMPRMNGLQLLAEVKEDSALKHIPVVILTGSREVEDIAKTNNMQADRYVTKPIDFEQFIKTVKSIIDFWLTTVKIQTEER